MIVKIKEIGFLETFEVRQPVLRPGKPIESCRFEGDDLPTTKHFGYFENEKLIGVVSIFKNNSPFFKTENQFQLRGMAILSSHQSKGIGSLLLEFAEKEIHFLKADLIWFNARIGAVDFYRKTGYDQIGGVFDIPNVGLHVVMFKKIK